MSALDRLLARLFRGTVDGLVEEALAKRDADGAPPSYHYRVHGDPTRLRIHPTAVVNDALFNVAGESTITVKEYAFFGHQVAVLAGIHDVNKFGRERQTTILREGRDVVIEEGAWLASQVLVLGPCVIGAHSVVAGGSLVIRDVEPFTIVAGRPATVVRRIDARP